MFVLNLNYSEVHARGGNKNYVFVYPVRRHVQMVAFSLSTIIIISLSALDLATTLVYSHFSCDDQTLLALSSTLDIAMTNNLEVLEVLCSYM